MEALITASVRAVSSMFAPGMLGIFVKSVLLTVLILFLFSSAVSAACLWLLAQYPQNAWTTFLSLGGIVGSHIIAWFLFPGVMPIIVNFFDNRIIRVIEQQDYPASQPIVSPPYWTGFWHDVRFSLKALALNILVLPLYLVPVLNLVLFYWLNGYLLGREFFIDVARRHQPAAQAEALRSRHNGLILCAGVLLTFLATIPLINLVAPFWGIAVMTHLYHRLSATPLSQVLPPS